MDVQELIDNLLTLGQTMIAPLKSVLVVLGNIFIQILQFIIDLLKTLVTKI